jgi:hypothetical protein
MPADQRVANGQTIPACGGQRCRNNAYIAKSKDTTRTDRKALRLRTRFQSATTALRQFPLADYRVHVRVVASARHQTEGSLGLRCRSDAYRSCNQPRPHWKRLMKGFRPERDLTGMPLEVPALPEEQYRLPLLVGHIFDCTILAGNALRPIVDRWCRHAMNGLLRAGRVVYPLREAAEKARAAARAAAALLEGDGRSTSSSMSSSDPGAGSAASDVFAGSSSEP